MVTSSVLTNAWKLRRDVYIMHCPHFIILAPHYMCKCLKSITKSYILCIHIFPKHSLLCFTTVQLSLAAAGWSVKQTGSWRMVLPDSLCMFYCGLIRRRISNWTNSSFWSHTQTHTHEHDFWCGDCHLQCAFLFLVYSVNSCFIAWRQQSTEFPQTCHVCKQSSCVIERLENMTRH